MVTNILDNGKMDYIIIKANIYTKINIYSKVIIKMEKNMEKEKLFIKLIKIMIYKRYVYIIG